MGGASKPIQRVSCMFQSIHHVHRGDGFPACMFRIGDGRANDRLEKHLQHPTRFLVHKPGDTLDTTAAR